MESIYEDEGRGIIWKADRRKTEMKEKTAFRKEKEVI